MTYREHGLAVVEASTSDSGLRLQQIMIGKLTRLAYSYLHIMSHHFLDVIAEELSAQLSESINSDRQSLCLEILREVAQQRDQVVMLFRAHFVSLVDVYSDVGKGCCSADNLFAEIIERNEYVDGNDIIVLAEIKEKLVEADQNFDGLMVKYQSVLAQLSDILSQDIKRLPLKPSVMALAFERAIDSLGLSLKAKLLLNALFVELCRDGLEQYIAGLFRTFIVEGLLPEFQALSSASAQEKAR